MMLIPRLFYFVPVMAGLLALSGCTSHPPQPIPKGENVVRTTEELRAVRQPLEKLQAEDFGYEKLTVPSGSGKPTTLFLNRDEAARLKAADRRQAFEIRYWYHEAYYGFGGTVGEADVESIRDGETVIIDRTRCRLHNQVMSRRLVHISYGLPMREFAEALYQNFPNAAVQLGGCVINDHSPRDTPAYVCPVCDVAYQTWRPTSEKERAP